MNRNALMAGFGRINSGTGSHWYPDVYPDTGAANPLFPVPHFIPNEMFEDRIFASPSHPAARNSLGFDRMEVLEQNPQAYRPRPQPFPTMRGFR